MPAANITRNRRRFLKEMLDSEHGEQIVNGSADGEVSIIYDYDEYQHNKKRIKEYHMTFFPTNRRIAVYQARGFLRRDICAQLPLTEIDEINYIENFEGKTRICVTEFRAAADSKYPTIRFKFNTGGHPSDMEQYLVILRSIARLAGVPINDFTVKESR